MRYRVIDGDHRLAAKRAGEATIRARVDDVEIEVPVDALEYREGERLIEARVSKIAGSWDARLAPPILVVPTRG